MNTYTSSNAPPVTIASIKAAMAAVPPLPPPSERIVGVQMNRIDIEKLKQRADAQPISVGGELEISGLRIYENAILPAGHYTTDRADGSIVIHRPDEKQVRIPPFDINRGDA